MKPTVSLVILTWNRWRSVSESLGSNLETAGYPIHELVHVDNGSSDDFLRLFTDRFQPAVQIRHAENRGVAVGYNRGLALSSGSHIVITGCDRVMPDGWLRTWCEHIEAIPETGVIACYSDSHEERMRGGPVDHKGKKIQRAIGVEARIHSKEFLFKTGFWREDFGLYGFEDSEWSDRAERVAREENLINYIIPGMRAQHLPDDDFENTTANIGFEEYPKFKRRVWNDPRRAALFARCHRMGSPYYNPYARIEPDLLDLKD